MRKRERKREREKKSFLKCTKEEADTKKIHGCKFF
jgi:hypothetical protein